MTLNKWLRLFGSTLLIGTVFIFVTGLLRYAFNSDFIIQFNINPNQVGYFLVFLFLLGTIYGTLSHIIFFCFLVINLFARGFTKYRFIWQGLQLIIIISLVGINLAYLNQMYLAAAVIIASSLLVAFYKARLTHMSAFVPTFFFMAVGTLVTLIPTWESEVEMLFIMPAVIASNAWQILRLHDVIKKQAPTDAETAPIDTKR